MHWKKILGALGVKFGDDKMTSQEYTFMRYITEYGKSYGTRAEYQHRLGLFTKTLADIESHNAKSGETHTLGLNHMSDWSHDEYKKLLGYRADMKTQNKTAKVLSVENIADDINWVTKGAVTKVKDQAQCGSCWAFSATGSIEGAEFLSGTKMLTSLSEQNLVDCSKANHACNGGLMDLAFQYVEEHPLMAEGDYPYTGHHSIFSRCKYEKSKGVGHVVGFQDVTSKSVDQMKAALALGPVSVAVEADKSVFQNYKSGVITSASCGENLDHGVLAVGYGTTENGDAYWLVKNSWGASWGDEGYLKIGENNICGILDQPSYPTE